MGLIPRPMFFRFNHANLLSAAFLAIAPALGLPRVNELIGPLPGARDKFGQKLLPRHDPISPLGSALSGSGTSNPVGRCRSQTVDEVLLIFCPPGPLPRTNRSSTSSGLTPRAASRLTICWGKIISVGGRIKGNSFLWCESKPPINAGLQLYKSLIYRIPYA